MKISQIKVGRVYLTKVGTGECVRAGGTFPPSVQIRITHPIPRGVVSVSPRDVKEEVATP